MIRKLFLPILPGLFSLPGLAQPTLTTLQPSAAPIGTTVTITGTGFAPAPAQNRVFFGPVAATVTAATATQLTVAVPAGATSGAAVTVTNLSTRRTVSSLTSGTPAFRVTFAGGTIRATGYRRTDVAAGFAPEQLAVGDFNRDGRPDVAATSRTQGTSRLAVLYNQGSRTFSAPQLVDANIVPVGVATADLNGDGNLDLVATNDLSRDVSVILGDGQGGFATPTNYALTSRGRGELLLADANGDAQPDILTIDGNQAVVLLNQGNGQFSAPGQLSAASASGSPLSFTAADFNADGRLDVAYTDVRGGQAGAVVRTRLAAGTYQDVFLAAPTPFPLANLRAADLNNDGRADLLANDAGGLLVWLRNAANTGFAAPVSTSLVPFQRTDVACTDLDGDGTLDLLTTAGNSPIELLRGLGTGAFAQPGTAVANPNGSRALALGDVDADGYADFLTANDFNAGFSLFTYLPGTTGTTNPPTLDFIPDQTADRTRPVQTVALTGISGGGGVGQFITVTATSSNPALVTPPTVAYASPAATGSLSYTVSATQGGTATITVTVSNGQTTNGTFSRSFLVTVPGTLGTSPAKGAVALALYPNPSLDGWFRVDASRLQAAGTLTVLDLTGRLVLSRPVEPRREPVPVQLPAASAAGVYVVRLVAAGQTWTTRLILSR
ncbi:T9SS type A sorting domain-containing protein [Hymenobacter psychrotolerans]|uniref:Por secretion system C-terminal sorting domain-containing protein n=1 Tax=Hymenobacter psychrotolerans DSM 18569 TaxID=1121959 RepID=A0A1M7ETK9_9BACT|nr:T9SS type A sorting domain-containing protein [Hymenobacter psychrotolerans]SHL94963.1 Por secretion system C-terminal sorting domain-containing protein [Hymenobacter psychrotolerans DSM 18569]